MFNETTLEIKRARKIIARVFQRRILILFLLSLPAMGFGATTDYFRDTMPYLSLFAALSFCLGITYWMAFIPSCLGPYLNIKRMIKWYAYDAKNPRELINRLDIISSVVRINLLFEGETPLWKTAKLTRRTSIDVLPFTNINDLPISNDNIYDMLDNDFYPVTFKRYIPILNVLYAIGDWISSIKVGSIFRDVTGINIRSWSKSNSIK